MQTSQWRKVTSRITPINENAHDRVGLARLFRDHRTKLVRYLRARLRSLTDAEDALQMTFLRLHARQDTLEINNLEALLYVTARNIATDILRQRSRRAAQHNTESSEYIDNVACGAAGAGRTLAAKHALSLIVKIIGELPPKYRESFIKYYFQDQDYGDIAIEMGVTQSMIRKYIIKATRYSAQRFHELERRK